MVVSPSEDDYFLTGSTIPVQWLSTMRKNSTRVFLCDAATFELDASSSCSSIQGGCSVVIWNAPDFEAGLNGISFVSDISLPTSTYSVCVESVRRVAVQHQFPNAPKYVNETTFAYSDAFGLEYAGDP